MAAAPATVTDGGGYTPQGGVLITGAAGFIGSHVAVELVKRHRYAVVVLDILDYPASIKNLAEIADAPGFAFVQGSVCNLALVGAGCRAGVGATHRRHASIIDGPFRSPSSVPRLPRLRLPPLHAASPLLTCPPLALSCPSRSSISVHGAGDRCDGAIQDRHRDALCGAEPRRQLLRRLSPVHPSQRHRHPHYARGGQAVGQDKEVRACEHG